MAACEPCWSAAFMLSRLRGTHQVDEYRELIAQAKPVSHDHITASEEPAGQDGGDR